MNNIFNYRLDMLEDYFLSIGAKKFNASQVYDWLYKKRVFDFAKMTNLKKELIAKLNATFTNDFLEIVRK